MMKTTPRASVVMPIHNCAPYLRSAIDSILGQEEIEFEVMLVDDGSTDGSTEIVKEYAEQDQRVRAFFPGKVGICHAINLGIQESRADQIARMDADDIALPNRLATQIRFLDDNPEYVAVGACVLQVDPEGLPISRVPLKHSHDDIVDELLAGRGSALIQPTVVMRKSAALTVGGYVPEYARVEDLDFFLKLSEVGKLTNLDEVLLHFRRHPKSYSALATNSEILPVKSQIVREALERRGLQQTAPLTDCYRPVTLAELYMTWAASAYWSGHWKTTRKYLAKIPVAVIRQPFSLWGVVQFLGRHFVQSMRGRGRRLADRLAPGRPLANTIHS